MRTLPSSCWRCWQRMGAATNKLVPPDKQTDPRSFFAFSRTADGRRPISWSISGTFRSYRKKCRGV
jgi:hypothetical protein